MSIVAGALGSALCRTMVVPHERAAGEWQAEWQVLPQLCDLAAGSLLNASRLAVELQIHPEAMRANLDCDHGLILAEAFMIGLADAMGREAAHDLVYQAAREVRSGDESFVDVLRRMVPSEHSGCLDSLIETTQYDAYLGETRALCDRGLEIWQRSVASTQREFVRAEEG